MVLIAGLFHCLKYAVRSYNLYNPSRAGNVVKIINIPASEYLRNFSAEPRVRLFLLREYKDQVSLRNTNLKRTLQSLT